ncbi:hypothetical protein VTN77DRAFT_6581 [Rasamsonia byssochlamydoides]|uniref:uncharacterized protein n=1 Tax=Rasamsonia byssochlamydoides TaxID=89139 RepID=UPI003744A562
MIFSSFYYTLALLATCVQILAFPLEASVETTLETRSTIPLTIKNYAALGDSYAAGIDAGAQLDSSCWRYNDSYPAQLNRTSTLGPDHEFQFVACSGTIMKNISPFSSSGGRQTIDKQIAAISTPDFATVSIGGNDAGFFNILNACVYRFYGPWSGNCTLELENAMQTIASDTFAYTYNSVMDALLAKNPAETFRIFANGYSPFFDDALSDDCNTLSLGYWSDTNGPWLTVDLRRSLNDVCNALNTRIGDIIQARNENKVIFVNWASAFDAHRFCQPGKGIEDGDNTWFYDADFRTTYIQDINIDTCE